MTSFDTLSDLLAAGRSDLIPGYTLSPFGLRDFADAENEFAKSHLAAAAGAAVGLPERLQRLLVETAAAQVADGRFNYGGPSFDRRAMSQATTPFLLWLALRGRHPQLTRPEAAALLTRENEQGAYYAVLELMGYGPAESGRDGRPAQWAAIVGALRKKGLDYDAIGRMTPVQVVAELGLDDRDAGDDDEAFRAARQKAQDAAFESICFVHGLTPDRLGRMTAESLLSLVSELFPNGNDPDVLVGAARAYAAREVSRRAAEAAEAAEAARREGEPDAA